MDKLTIAFGDQLSYLTFPLIVITSCWAVARGRQHLHLLHRRQRRGAARRRVVAHAAQVQQVQAAAFDELWWKDLLRGL